MPCPRTRYKTAVGTGECSLTCPTNADSELASIGLDDCFCRPGFHAELVNGKLESCKSCSYQGLVCLGGWEGEDLNVSRIHAQPLAQRPGSKSPFLAFGFSPRPGFYQTGLTFAVECNILFDDGTSVCQGGEACVAERVGLAVKGCHGAWGGLDARDDSLELCEAIAAAEVGGI